MPDRSTTTRDRLLDEAMRLFGTQGYRATTVVQIEEAAGLSPGSGGMYHHFRSKEDLLSEGVDRHLDRMRALRDIRLVLGTLPDRNAELGVLARYGLQVLREEAPVLRLVAAERSQLPAALQRAREIGLVVLRQELATWLIDLAPQGEPEAVRAAATVAIDALLARPLQASLVTPVDDSTERTESADSNGVLDDDAFVTAWVAMVGARLDTLPA
jgi:AcrR family transcriptional regulator